MIGYIYYILDLTNADMYIGSCWKHIWSDRKSAHKTCKDYNRKAYEIIKNNNYIFEVLEENDFIDKEERFKKEQYYIDNNKCINTKNAFGLNIENVNKLRMKYYYEDKKKYSDRTKKYYDENKEKLKNYQKEYKLNNNNFLKRRVCCIKCKKEFQYINLKKHNNIYH